MFKDEFRFYLPDQRQESGSSNATYRDGSSCDRNKSKPSGKNTIGFNFILSSGVISLVGRDEDDDDEEGGVVFTFTCTIF